MRQSDFDHDSWTCQRASDKSLVQLDFLIGAMVFHTQHIRGMTSHYLLV